MAKMLIFLSCMLFGRAAADGATCEGGAVCDETPAWAQEEEPLQGLEMLQMRSKKAETSGEAQAESQDVIENPECKLPEGARWCEARSGEMAWTMAVYSEKEDEVLSKEICANGYWQFEEPKSLGIKEDDGSAAELTQLVLLDVGAHVGWYSFMFAAHGHKAIAVEPMTANRALMNATLCMNPDLASKVTVLSTALARDVSPGRKCGIFSSESNAGDGVMACSSEEIKAISARAQAGVMEREEVELTTLDDLIESNPDVFGDRIDVVKENAKFQECNVLAGSNRFLTNFKPKYMMIEASVTGDDILGNTFDCVAERANPRGTYNMHIDNFNGPTYTREQAHSWLQNTVNVYFSQ
mmetsp:Transcript_127097/g.220265  ORF Transcript_127097/g.220265 Transcript_127097/m.220265 type:complete len:354 (+) Transcript_127097:70-1131(+)